MRILADTNLLVRLELPLDPHHAAAKSAIAAVIARGDDVCLLTQNVYEYYVVATRPEANNGMGLSTAETLRQLLEFEDVFSLLPETPTCYATWKALVAETETTGKRAHDARIAAAMIAHGISHILTFNASDFNRFKGVEVVDPFSLTQPGH